VESVSIADIYEEILQGGRKTFPKGTWNYKNDAVRLVKYLIDEKLQWTRDDVCSKLSKDTFKKWKLGGMLQKCFNDSPYEALEATYPEMYRPWELAKTPNGFWTVETGVEATRWLIEEKLKWSHGDVCNYLDRSTFINANLSGMLQHSFDNHIFAAIDATFPGKYKPWELAKSPQGLWTRETGSDAVKWLIEEKLQWTRDDVCSMLGTQTFRDNGLGGLLGMFFQGSLFTAINTAYPDEYKPWELSNAPRNFWTQATAIQATKWLIEEKLAWSHTTVCTHLSVQVFKDACLNGMLAVCFKGSPYAAIDAAYPGEYKPWELRRSPNLSWSYDKAIEAIKWLIDERLKWSHDEICTKLTFQVFVDNGLSGMVQKFFDGSPYKAVDAAYPNKFKPWYLKNSPKKL